MPPLEIFSADAHVGVTLSLCLLCEGKLVDTCRRRENFLFSRFMKARAFPAADVAVRSVQQL